MNIFLYADNFISRRALPRLNVTGHNVIAILDQKYNFPAFDGSVYTCGLNNIYKSEIIPTSLVIICLSDATKHLDVVKLLQKKGFSRILYIPMHFNRPIEEQSQLRIIYNQFFTGNYLNLEKIPFTVAELSNEHSCWIIKEDDKQIVFLCNIGLLYTSTPEIINKNILPNMEPQIEKLLKISNMKIIDLIPYIELFDYLSGKSDKQPDDYLRLQRNSEIEMKALLDNRKKLFAIYESNYEYNYSFFYETPAKVIWNSSGYFNIEDGLHRSIFLLSKGKTMIPVCSNKEDYNLYKIFVRKESGLNE